MKNPSPEQVKKWNHTYYVKNRVKRRAQYTKYRDELREWYREYKSTLKCERCGFSHPAALHFHHKVPSQKQYDISLMINEGLSRKTILHEISKCEILCANCHAIEHAVVADGEATPSYGEPM